MRSPLKDVARLLPFILIATCVALADPVVIPGPKARTIDLTYRVQLPALEQKTGPLDIFVPIAQSDEHQHILSRNVESNFDGKIHTEDKYGNSYWHAHVDKPEPPQGSITVKYRIVREVVSTNRLESAPKASYPDALPTEITRYLSPDARVPTSGPVLDAMRKDISHAPLNTPFLRSMAIYDFVIDTMEYKKVGTGWGNGDTYWACSHKYGNCSDFHALFISLARAEGIPTRFEIGFPIPLEAKKGRIEGYHCWATMYLPGLGWTPVDASEAKKHPEQRELFFGHQPADRVQFTIGRDLQLGPDHHSGPLNFFIYPLVEVGGKKVGNVVLDVSYVEVRNERRVATQPRNEPYHS